MTTRAQRLRQNPTPAEIRFWRVIWPLRHAGHHFRKQVALGPYVVDFACHRAKLVVEVDGDTHYSDAALLADERRDTYLRSRGYKVLRFTNVEVMGNGEGVFRVVQSALAEAPPPCPPRKGEGDITRGTILQQSGATPSPLRGGLGRGFGWSGAFADRPQTSVAPSSSRVEPHPPSCGEGWGGGSSD